MPYSANAHDPPWPRTALEPVCWARAGGTFAQPTGGADAALVAAFSFSLSDLDGGGYYFMNG